MSIIILAFSLNCHSCLKTYQKCMLNSIKAYSTEHVSPEEMKDAQDKCKNIINKCSKKNNCEKVRV